MVKEIKSESELNQFTSQNKLIVIDFFATWCGPCKTIAPDFVKLSEEYKDVIFLKVDVDDCGGLDEKFSVSAMPTFAFVKNGKKVDEVVGANINSVKTKIKSLK